MYQLTKEDLQMDEEQGMVWVRDDVFQDGETVDFNILDFCVVEMKDNEGKQRYHAKQKMKVLSGKWKGKEYTHTWWDVLAPGDQSRPGRSLKFLTWALKGLGLQEDELAGPLTEAVNNTVGRSFTANCSKKPKLNGNGHYVSWRGHKPLV